MAQQTDENGQPLTYWGGLADEAFEKENSINNLAEEVYLEHENNDILYGDSLELRLTYKAGVVDGYNKAKETLYTKEQLIEVIELARLIDYNGSNDYYMSEDEIIQALKP